MRGAEVLTVLQAKNINQLFHANSVSTSVNFLRLNALASRQYIECNRLIQSPQYTDDVDRRWGIWNDIFTDSVDIHGRISNWNQYGPVLFELDADVLNTLPQDAEVLVTKSNPTKWSADQTPGDHYFLNRDELANGLSKGAFDQMITFRIPTGLLPFGNYLRQIILDDIGAAQSADIGHFNTVMGVLQRSATAGNVTAVISPRTCVDGCKCRASYVAKPRDTSRLFSV